jgi:hypothetical protein
MHSSSLLLGVRQEVRHKKAQGAASHHQVANPPLSPKPVASPEQDGPAATGSVSSFVGSTGNEGGAAEEQEDAAVLLAAWATSCLEDPRVWPRALKRL